MNLFAPNPVPVEAAAFRRYAELIAPEAARYGLRLDGAAVEDDDRWHDKLDVLRAHPVPVVSFTFGLPGRDPERVHLWAGAGFPQVTAEPAGLILTRLVGRL